MQHAKLIPSRSFSNQSAPILNVRSSAYTSSVAPYILRIVPYERYYAASLSHPANAIELFDTESLRSVRVLDGHEGGVSALGLMDGQGGLVSAGQDGSVKVWDQRRTGCVIKRGPFFFHVSVR